MIKILKLAENEIENISYPLLERPDKVQKMISLDENCSISRLISFEINFNFSGFLKSARARKCSEQIHQYIKRGSGKENQMRRRGYSRAPVRIFSLRLSVTVATMLMVYSDLSSLLVDIAFVFLDPMIGYPPSPYNTQKERTMDQSHTQAPSGTKILTELLYLQQSTVTMLFASGY